MPNPYAAIARLVDHVKNTMTEDWNEREERLGPIANSEHILYAALTVEQWLNANLMTVWAVETLEAIEGLKKGAAE